MDNFSKELKKELIEYFQKKYKITISEEKAELYLNSLAEFYLTLAD
ncbi:MAG: hypothetical protein PHF68_03730 [Candidatus ainarchaeum sp.]|nr:hypothetical protein [Candidatus ainarchaeum sp.]